MEHERLLLLRITGLVQGVGFRAFVQREARRLGVHGWVRNRADGSVETLVAGAAEAVGEMLIRCRHGPDGAQVEAAEPRVPDPEILAEAPPEPGFPIRGTS